MKTVTALPLAQASHSRSLRRSPRFRPLRWIAIALVVLAALAAFGALYEAVMAAANTPGAEIEPMRRLGLLRLFAVQLYTLLNPESAVLPAEMLTSMMMQSTHPTAIEASQSEFIEMERSDALLQSASLGDMPLRVLVSEQANSVDPMWMKGQEDQAARSTNSDLTLLPGGHFLMYGNADGVVAAVREVLQLTER